MTRVQSAAATFRRSGALVELEGEEKRIFDAVVKPERRTADADGAVEAERERLRQEIGRGESMLANERFVQNAPSDVVAAEREKLERYRAELDALGG
jgi:valyl-tRNA synthetase